MPRSASANAKPLSQAEIRSNNAHPLHETKPPVTIRLLQRLRNPAGISPHGAINTPNLPAFPASCIPTANPLVVAPGFEKPVVPLFRPTI
jgi:hypothetical protein